MIPEYILQDDQMFEDDLYFYMNKYGVSFVKEGEKYYMYRIREIYRGIFEMFLED